MRKLGGHVPEERSHRSARNCKERAGGSRSVLRFAHARSYFPIGMLPLASTGYSAVNLSSGSALSEDKGVLARAYESSEVYWVFCGSATMGSRLRSTNGKRTCCLHGSHAAGRYAATRDLPWEVPGRWTFRERPASRDAEPGRIGREAFDIRFLPVTINERAVHQAGSAASTLMRLPTYALLGEYFLCISSVPRHGHCSHCRVIEVDGQGFEVRRGFGIVISVGLPDQTTLSLRLRDRRAYITASATVISGAPVPGRSGGEHRYAHEVAGSILPGRRQDRRHGRHRS